MIDLRIEVFPEDPFPCDALGKVTLGGFFAARARARREAFLGVAVAVYPGAIDRLW